VVYVNQYYEVNTTTSNATSSYYLGGRLIATLEKGVSENGTLRYYHQDYLNSTTLITGTSGSQIGTTVKYLPFGTTRSGSIPTDILFTGKTLDATGLYFYGARYYDSVLGRFASPDGVSPDLNNPQSLNKYAYCFNNPLKYNDPTGHWPDWGDIWGGIKNAGNWIKEKVQEGLQVVQTKAVEIKQTIINVIPHIIQAVSNIYQSVTQKIVEKYEEVKNVVTNIPKYIGIESTSSMSTTLVKDVRVINVRKDSLIDKILPSDTVTIYPFGVFTNKTMSKQIEKEEGYHWKDQSTAGPFVPVWYACYGIEYGVNYLKSGFNSNKAHDAVSFERYAMQYAMYMYGK
jgi:RHS repeat-associated protein